MGPWRDKTAARAALRVVAGLVAVSLLPGPWAPPAPAQAGRKPWDLPEDERDFARKHKAPDYWYERYLSAESILEKQGNDPAALDEVIALLQLAIAKHPRSSAKEIHPTERREFSYVPYYLLAEAYYRKHDLQAATLCLREADAQGAVTRSARAGDYQRLQGEFARAAELERLRGTSDVLRAWQRGDLGACISDASRGIAADTLRDTQALTDQKKPNDQIRDRLVRGATDIVRAEGARMQARLDELRAAPWSKILDAGQLGVPQGVCDLGALTVDPARIDDAQQKLVACCDATAQGLRNAARRACDELKGVRGRVVAQLEVERRLGGAPPAEPPPAVPDACSRTSWGDLDLAAANAALDAIAYPAAAQRLDGALAAVSGRLASRQEELQRELSAARQGVLAADRACAMELRLGESNTRLGTLATDIDRALASRDPAKLAELADVGKQISDARDTLVTRAVDGARSLGAMREQFEGIDASSFSSLPAAADAFRQSPSQTSLDRLCQNVAAVRGAIQTWGQQNIPVFVRQLGTYRWFLEIAAGWRQPGPADERLDCIETSLDALPGAPGANAGAWVSQAGTAISQARECLADYRERHDRWAASVRGDVDAMADAAERLGQASDLPKIKEMRERLGATREALDRTSGLSTLPDSLTDDALRRDLDAAGLTVPDERFRRLAELTGAEAAEGRALVRDEALGPELDDAVATLDAWRPIVSKLGPYLALDRAIEDYNHGDLDAAILTLRRGQAEPAQGRAAAVVHATLSFLLYNKSELMKRTEAESRVQALLLDDARTQAVAAVRAEPGFRLPAFLGNAASFERFFESCRSM